MKISKNDSCIKSKINIEFNISGQDFFPEDINEILKISPNRYYTINDQVKNKPIYRDHSLWGIETGLQLSNDINIQLNQLFDMLNGKFDLIEKIKKMYNVMINITVIIYFVNEDKPAIYFTNSDLFWINKIGAEILFDYYFFEDDY